MLWSIKHLLWCFHKTDHRPALFIGSTGTNRTLCHNDVDRFEHPHDCCLQRGPFISFVASEQQQTKSLVFQCLFLLQQHVEDVMLSLVHSPLVQKSEGGCMAEVQSKCWKKWWVREFFFFWHHSWIASTCDCEVHCNRSWIFWWNTRCCSHPLETCWLLCWKLQGILPAHAAAAKSRQTPGIFTSSTSSSSCC